MEEGRKASSFQSLLLQYLNHNLSSRQNSRMEINHSQLADIVESYDIKNKQRVFPDAEAEDKLMFSLIFVLSIGRILSFIVFLIPRILKIVVRV